jgi:serine/threonine-protein kinase RsbT
MTPMDPLKSEILPIRSSEDIVRIRQAVRTMALEIGLSLVDQTKVITAASEIARNTLDYGGGGEATIEIVSTGLRKGVRLLFVDEGPGIPDMQRAMTDGYTTGKGLGLGLSGAKRLVNEFEIESEVGKGTRITLVRWKP